MIRSSAHEVPEFLESARQYTPVFVRQFVDAGVCNVEAFNLVEFKNPAFQDTETLIREVIDNPHRRQLNRGKPLKAVLTLTFRDPQGRRFHESHRLTILPKRRR